MLTRFFRISRLQKTSVQLIAELTYSNIENSENEFNEILKL